MTVRGAFLWCIIGLMAMMLAVGVGGWAYLKAHPSKHVEFRVGDV